MISTIRLTRREREIAGLLGANASSNQIARNLLLSPRTEQHILRAYKKLGISNRSDLARIARTWFEPFIGATGL